MEIIFITIIATARQGFTAVRYNSHWMGGISVLLQFRFALKLFSAFTAIYGSRSRFIVNHVIIPNMQVQLVHRSKGFITVIAVNFSLRMLVRVCFMKVQDVFRSTAISTGITHKSIICPMVVLIMEVKVALIVKHLITFLTRQVISVGPII